MKSNLKPESKLESKIKIEIKMEGTKEKGEGGKKRRKGHLRR